MNLDGLRNAAVVPELPGERLRVRTTVLVKPGGIERVEIEGRERRLKPPSQSVYPEVHRESTTTQTVVIE